MNLTVEKIVDTLEELIATADMMTKEQIEDAVQGSAIWVWDNINSISLVELSKIDRLHEILMSKAA